MKIIVGAVVSLPPYTPGIVWHVLQYLLGFRKLGHEVYYLEQTKPEWCVDAQGQRCDFERSRNRDLFRTTMERFDLAENAGLICGDGDATVGLSRDAILNIAKDADLLINMSGCITADFILSNVKARAYVDQDPVYTQLWQTLYGAKLNFDVHDVFFSMGLNIGTAHTRILDCGLEWHYVRPPIIPEYWPFRIDSSCTRFTTIASLRGFAVDSRWAPRMSPAPMAYPGIEEVELTSPVVLGRWLRFLLSPGWLALGHAHAEQVRLREAAIPDRIIARFLAAGGWTPARSKAVGWEHT